MTKRYAFILTLAAIAVLSASAATSASAASKLLFNTLNITALLNFTATGLLLMEDINVFGEMLEIDVLCSVIFDGMVEAGGTELFFEELLMLNGELLAEAGNDMIECESAECTGELLLNALHLPWTAEVQLDAGGAYLIDIKEVSGKNPAFEFICLHALIGEVKDLCEGLSSMRLRSMAGVLLGYFNQLALGEAWGAESQLIACSIGGAGKGLIESEDEEALPDTEASGLSIEPVGGGAFSVSE